LWTARAMRHAVLVRISPERATLYRLGGDGRVYNRFRYSIDNRGRKPAAVMLAIRQLPDATLAMAPNPVPVKGGDSVEGEFEISAPARPNRDLVSHFTIVTSTIPDQVTDSFPMTFLAPTEVP
jgi:hypothetical protein